MFLWLKYFYMARWLLRWLLYLFIELPILTIFTIVLLPYGFFFFSSNFAMRANDMPPVQLYLDHFESLFPDLIASVAAAHQQRKGCGVPSDISFWPRKTSEDNSFTSLARSAIKKVHTFSHAAGLFARLEADRVCDRRVLWTFLRDKVEQAGLVNEDEKKAFSVVMEKMCSHQMRDLVESMLPWKRSSPAHNESSEKLDRSMPVEMPIVHATRDSIEWILHKGALVVPTSAFHLHGLQYFEMWGGYKEDADLEKGLGDYWQIIDLRKPPHPWERKD